MPSRNLRRVLVVDDDVQVAQMLCAALRLAGVAPVVAHCYEQTLLALEEGVCDALILDLSLPDSRGRETIDHIPELLRKGAARIFVMTGGSITDEVVDAACAAGASEVMAKTDPRFLAKLVWLATH